MNILTKYFKKLKRKQLLKSTNFGRENGWIIQHKKRKIAELNTPKFVDMFWFEYEIKILNEDYNNVSLSELWEKNEIKFISKSLNEYCDNSVILNFGEDGCNSVYARGLHMLK